MNQDSDGCSGTNTYYPSADTFLSEKDPDRNYGQDNELETSLKSSEARVGLLQFDINDLPTDTTIDFANFNINVSTQKNQSINIYRMTSAWEEGVQIDQTCTDGATWDLPDCSANWAGGGAFSGADYDFGTTYGPLDVSTTGFKSATVTGLVDNWLNTGPNYGLAMVIGGGTGTGDTAKYDSFENGNDADRPYLTVNWSIPAGTGTTVTLAALPYLISESGQVTVTMTVEATALVTGVTPPTSLNVTTNGGVTYSLSSGPTPAGPVSIDSGSPATFTYVYDVTAGSVPGDIQFSGSPTLPAGVFADGTTDTVLVVPLLQYSVELDVPFPGDVTEVCNIATFTDSDVFSDGSDSPIVCTQVERPILEISKAVEPQDAVPGDTVVFTITYSNTGTINATNVVISDTVPSPLVYLSCDDGDSDGTCSESGGVVTWTDSTLPPSTPRSVSFTVEVPDPWPQPEGVYEILNIADITSTEFPDPIYADAAVLVVDARPQLEIFKLQDSNSISETQDLVSPGDYITYTLYVTNTGTAAASNVVVTDQVSDLSTYQTGSANCSKQNPSWRLCRHKLQRWRSHV